MKTTPIIIRTLLIIGLAFVIGASGRWAKYKFMPSETSEREHFEIDASMVKNAEPNKTYYGTVEITIKHIAVKWPEIETTIKRDTLSSEDGGYFGVPN